MRAAFRGDIGGAGRATARATRRRPRRRREPTRTAPPPYAACRPPGGDVGAHSAGRHSGRRRGADASPMGFLKRRGATRHERRQRARIAGDAGGISRRYWRRWPPRQGRYGGFDESRHDFCRHTSCQSPPLDAGGDFAGGWHARGASTRREISYDKKIAFEAAAG